MKKHPSEDCSNWSESPKKTLTQALLEKGARLAASERKRLNEGAANKMYPWPDCAKHYMRVAPDRPFMCIKSKVPSYAEFPSIDSTACNISYETIPIPPILGFGIEAFLPVKTSYEAAEWFMDLQDIVRRTVNNRKDRTSKESILSRLMALSKGEGEGGEGGTYKEGDKVEGDVV